MFAEVMDGGQITLPSALLNQLEWKSGDKLDIFVENGELRLRGTEKAEKKEFFYIDDKNETNPGLLALERQPKRSRGLPRKPVLKARKKRTDI